MEFGRSCGKLQFFLYVSTAYVNGQRERRIIGKPFQMGVNLTSTGTFGDGPTVGFVTEEKW